MLYAELENYEKKNYVYVVVLNIIDILVMSW